MSAWKKKRKIMRRYDLTAHLYDMRYSEEQVAKIQAALEALDIRPVDAVLDAGCGTGLLFAHVADEVKKVVGIDISRISLLLAKKRASSLANVHLILADADNLPFRENLFTKVFAFTLVQNSPDPHATLDELGRVVEAKAFVVVSGLKRIFSLETFQKLLGDSGLEIVALKDEALKCYVAVCTKVAH